VTVSRNHLDSATIEFLNQIKQPYDILPTGSSLKFCLIAEGLADLYPRFGPTYSWDTAAGQAILNFAVGFVKKINGDTLSYSKSELINPVFLATSNNFFQNFNFTI